MTIYITITGKVQGVFFRASAKEKADFLGIKGWVKNTPDGNVEIMASGEPELVEQFIAWCKKGPSKANVGQVEIISQQDKKFETFSVLK